MFGLRFLQREPQESGSWRASDSSLIGRALYTLRSIAIVFNSKVRAEVFHAPHRVGGPCAALPFVALPSGAEANFSRASIVLRSHERQRRRFPGLSLAGLDRPAWVRNPGRHVPSAAHGGALVLDGLLRRPMPHAIFFHGGYAIHGS
jgi:hypothetical protein